MVQQSNNPRKVAAQILQELERRVPRTISVGAGAGLGLAPERAAGRGSGRRAWKGAR